MSEDPRATRTGYTPIPRHNATAIPGVGAPAGATAAEMAQTRFGGPTRVQTTVVTLTTTVAQVLAANPRRVFWSMINRGVVNAAVDFDSAMTFANGLLMGAAGGFVQSDVEEDGESVAWPVFGACESSTCTVRIIEVVRV